MKRTEGFKAGREPAPFQGSAACLAYDAEFVSLARDLGALFVTMDKAILKGFPDTAVLPSRFLASRKP